MTRNRYLRAARISATVAALAAATALRAQALPFPPPQNVLQLAATGTVEVQQDILSIALTTSREGPDPVVVQEQLKKALDAALAIARAPALALKRSIASACASPSTFARCSRLRS